MWVRQSIRNSLLGCFVALRLLLSLLQPLPSPPRNVWMVSRSTRYERAAPPPSCRSTFSLPSSPSFPRCLPFPNVCKMSGQKLTAHMSVLPAWRRVPIDKTWNIGDDGAQRILKRRRPPCRTIGIFILTAFLNMNQAKVTRPSSCGRQRRELCRNGMGWSISRSSPMRGRRLTMCFMQLA